MSFDMLIAQKSNEKFSKKNYQKLLQEIRIVFESIVEGIIITDREGKVLSINQSAVDMIGCDDAVGKNLKEVIELVNEDTRQKVKDPVEKVLNTGEIQGMANHTILVTKDSREIAIADTASPVVDSSGLIQGVVMVFRDVSEKRKLEKKLEKREKTYRTLFENTGAATCLIAEDTTIILANEKMTELTGYSQEEIEEKMSWQSLVVSKNDLKRMQNYHQQRREKNSDVPNHYEFNLKDNKGREKNILATVDIIEDSNQSIASFIDITMLKDTEKKLNQKISSLNKMIEGVIEALGATVKVRDNYTYQHQKETAKLTAAIAEKLNMSDNEIKGLHLASLVHDIGKICIPAEILTKNGRLTELEFEIIKTHAAEGYKILGGLEFPWPIAEIVKQHHEKVNGSGYPDGLRGDEILPEAKVLTVADTVAAMNSHRPYRPALGIDKALDEIKKNKGILYEPEIVDACIEVFESGYE